MCLHLFEFESHTCHMPTKYHLIGSKVCQVHQALIRWLLYALGGVKKYTHTNPLWCKVWLPHYRVGNFHLHFCSDIIYASEALNSRTKFHIDPKKPQSCYISYAKYRIAGNFDEVINLASWRFCGNSPNLKPTNIISYTIALCGSTHDRQI